LKGQESDGRAGCFSWGVTELQGASTHSSEKGTEYELEFEDEYDSGTIAKSQRLFFPRFRFVGINRLVEF
jgi:hypothetical protein